MSRFFIEYTVPINGSSTQRSKKNTLPIISRFHSNNGFISTFVQNPDRAKGESISKGSKTDKVNCTIRIAIVMNPALRADNLELKKLVKKPI